MLPFLIGECLTRADTVRPLRTLKEIRGLDRMFQFFSDILHSCRNPTAVTGQPPIRRGAPCDA